MWTMRKGVGRLFFGLFSLIAIYSLSQPLCCLILEHHFAERQPNHVHLYLGQVVPQHVHSYEIPHTHPRLPEADNARSQEAPESAPAPDSIVCLTNNDGMTQSGVQFTVPCSHLSRGFPNPEDSSLTFGIPATDAILQDAYLPLPKKPPRI